MTSSLSAIAKEYVHKHKFSVIPVGKDKRPLLSWKEFQTRYATDEEIDTWFKNPDAQIGIVTGSISNLTVVDVEYGGDPSFLPQNTKIIKTGGGGWHYYYKYDEGMMNKARIRDLVDIRSEGGYVVAPPSETDKGEYSVVAEEEIMTFPRHLFSERAVNMPVDEAAKSQNAPQIDDYPGFGPGQRNDQMARFIGHVLTRIHPALWDTEALKVVHAANARNLPPLPYRELMATYNSIKGREMKNPEPRDWKKQAEPPKEVFADDGSDEVMLLSEVAARNSIGVDDIYPFGMPYFDQPLMGGAVPGDLIIIAGPTANGKCLGKGTPVIMYDGKIKMVEDVVVGDKLMGPDSLSRTVLSTNKGKEMLYRVTQKNGDQYIVNESHILSLKTTKYNSSAKGKIVNIPLVEYLQKSKTFKHTHKGWKARIDFPDTSHAPLVIPPYILGVWLGDGHSHVPSVTSMDEEVVFEWEKYAKSVGMKITKKSLPNNRASEYHIVSTGGRGRGRVGVNIVKNNLQSIGVLKNKHIPIQYKTAGRPDRMQLIAGLIDTDGSVNKPHGYEFSNKNKQLIDDFVFVARSLGFSCGISSRHIKGEEYYRVCVSGDVDKIPVRINRKKILRERKMKKDSLVTGIHVEKIGVGDYYGFSITGDRLFLLGDFTVTHNTLFAQDLTVGLLKSPRGAKALFFSYEVLPQFVWQKYQQMGLKDVDPIYIPLKHTSGSIDWIEKKIIEAKKRFDVKIVCIDHLGFLTPKAGGVNLKQVSSNYSTFLTQVARDVKQIAVQEELIIITPAHVRKTEELSLNDIANSAGIAQEADVVFLIERERNKSKEAAEYYTPYTRISLAKNRRTGQSVVAWFTLFEGRFMWDTTKNKQEEMWRNLDKPTEQPSPPSEVIPAPEAPPEQDALFATLLKESNDEPF